jgi:DNA-binding NtrC family response regulator
MIAIADPNAARREDAVNSLNAFGVIRQCSNAGELLQIASDEVVHVVVMRTPADGAPETIRAAHDLRRVQPGTKVIVIADASSEDLVLDALRAGVADYLRSPLKPAELSEAVARAMPKPETADHTFDELVGNSEPTRELKRLIQKFAPLNSTVLITGESGTGKEIVARLVHQHSRRAKAPFVCVNCAALPDLLVESELFGHERGAFTGAITRQLGQMRNANGGTLFLDEIGDMSLTAQSKMLRALEMHEVQPLGAARCIPIDVRVVTATHHDLEKLIAEGKFREDLYYRLNVARIHVEPLRRRRDDIAVLANHFLGIMNRLHDRAHLGLTSGALETLLRNEWPGNVRQLRNVIEAATVICTSDWISDSDLRGLHSFSAGGPHLTTAATPVIPTKKVVSRKDALLDALEATQWNMTRTAELLRWSRSTLYRTVARYNIKRDGERSIAVAGHE